MVGNLIELKKKLITRVLKFINSINFDSTEKLDQHVGYTDKTF